MYKTGSSKKVQVVKNHNLKHLKEVKEETDQRRDFNRPPPGRSQSPLKYTKWRRQQIRNFSRKIQPERFFLEKPKYSDGRREPQTTTVWAQYSQMSLMVLSILWFSQAKCYHQPNVKIQQPNKTMKRCLLRAPAEIWKEVLGNISMVISADFNRFLRKSKMGEQSGQKQIQIQISELRTRTM